MLKSKLILLPVYASVAWLPAAAVVVAAAAFRPLWPPMHRRREQARATRGNELKDGSVSFFGHYSIVK